MVNRIETFGWTGLAAILLLTAAPAFATEGRTYWSCTDIGCVQIQAPPGAVTLVVPVKRPAPVHAVVAVLPTAPAVQPVPARLPVVVRQRAEVTRKAVPLETLIDLSLVTGVFQ